MTDVTRILSAIEHGDPTAAEQLSPLVYDELRKLAAQKMREEKPGQTLQATALVHEAYIRLVDVEKAQHWNSRGHFFAAAAEALGISLATAKRYWTYARAWLYAEVDPDLKGERADPFLSNRTPTGRIQGRPGIAGWLSQPRRPLRRFPRVVLYHARAVDVATW